jgi:shikimate kinase
MKNRGVVLREGQTLESLYEERSVLYEQYADVVVDETGLGPEETLEELLLQLQRYAQRMQ